jgi:hypothetical protein
MLRKVLKKNWPGVQIYDDVEQSQQSDWLQTELESMSSQAAFPAKTSQSQERVQASRVSAVDYGQSAPVLLGSFDPDTPSLKTSQTCLMENGEIGLSEFSGTFPRSGMMRSGTVYQLPNLARTITEIGVWIVAYPNSDDGRGGDCSKSLGWQSRMESRCSGKRQPIQGASEDVADTYESRLQRWLQNGIAYQEGREVESYGHASECCPQWERNRDSYWATEPDVGRVANGVPSRSHRLKCLGNAVVPQIPELIGRASIVPLDENDEPPLEISPLQISVA